MSLFCDKYKIIFACFLGMLLSACGVEHTPEWDGKYAGEFRQGSGEEEDPWLISSAQELAWLARSVNEGNMYEGKYFKLTEDLDMRGTDERCRWPGIGDSVAFRGYFDGDGHRIRNICIEGRTTEPCGLFGKMWGEVEDLIVEKVWFIGKTDDSKGGLAGMINLGFIRKCLVKDVNGTNGGIAGVNLGGCIYDCHVMGEINGGNDTDPVDVGGICGRNWGKISGCAFTGTVYGSGIAGILEGGDIEDCYNRGQVKGEDCNGIVSYVLGDGKIRNCYNAGSGGEPLNYSCENSYYDTKNYQNLNLDDYPGGKSSRFMKSPAFVKLLNEGKSDGEWQQDVNGVNNGYPVLKRIPYGKFE